MINQLQERFKETVTGWAINDLHIKPDGFWIDHIRYGASMLIVSLINTPLLILFLFYILRLTVIEIVPFAISYSVLRLASFGVHADSTTCCALLNTSYYVGGSLMGKYVMIPFPVGLILCIIVLLIFVRYAPAETKKRPLSHNKFLFRILSFMMIFIAIFMYIWLKIKMQDNIANLVLMGMCCQSINLLPLMYKIFARKESVS